jgi:hypothetical protein
MIRLINRAVPQALLLAAGLSFAAISASAHTYIVGLAADCVPPTPALSTPLMQLFLDHLHLGDSLVVYDALRRAVVATITIPADRPAFEIAAVRTRQLGSGLVAIRRFLEARCTGAPPSADPAGNLFLPQFLDEVSRILIPTLPRGGVSVLVVGSAFYNDAHDPAFSMLDGRYPSDSHLKAKNTRTPFSTVVKRYSLAGIDIHYCYTDTNWINDAHKESVLRWWSLFVSSQQGILATFTNDLSTCFERFERSVTAGAPSFAPEMADHGLKMLTATRTILVQEAPPPTTPATPPENRPLPAPKQAASAQDQLPSPTVAAPKPVSECNTAVRGRLIYG